MSTSSTSLIVRTELGSNVLGILALVIATVTVFSLVKLASRASVHASSSAAEDATGGDHYLYAAIYSTIGGRVAILGLNNTLSTPISAQITLYNKHGEALSTPDMSVTLEPHRNHGYNIADWIAEQEGFEEGSALVKYHGKSMTLGAQETITDASHGLNFDVHLSEYDDFMSSRVEGLWWGLENQSEAQVFIANTEENTTTVTPTFYVNGIQYDDQPLSIGGHQSSSIDIEHALHKLHVQGNITLGGISLSYNNGPGAIAVVGVVQNKHTGFSTTLRFIDASSQKTTTLHGASLPIGYQNSNFGFATGTRFTPHVIVRNTTGLAVTVNPIVRYTLFDQPHTTTLSQVLLSPYEVRELNLNPVVSAIGSSEITDSGIEIQHTGQPGAVMVYAAAVSQSRSQVLDVPVKDPSSMPFQGGSYPWNIAGDNHAVLHVKNIEAPTDGEKRDFMVKLYFEGGEYNVALQRIEAGQTGTVDIRKLRDDQVKDVLGNVIPLNVTSGQLAWYGRANKGQFIGRLAEYNPVAGTSSSFSCPQNCLCSTGFQSGRINPSAIAEFVNNNTPLDALETDEDCNHANQFTYEIYNPTFFSSNTNVVTIADKTATLVGVGDAEISASWDANFVEQECTALASDGECVGAICPNTPVGNPIADMPVEVSGTPDHVRVISDQQGVVCQGGLQVRQITVQIVDVNNVDVTKLVFVGERFADLSTNTCGNGNPQPTSCGPADSGGRFTDSMAVSDHIFCDSSISRNSGCGYTLTSTWSWCNHSRDIWQYHGETRSNFVSVDGGAQFAPGTLLFAPNTTP